MNVIFIIYYINFKLINNINLYMIFYLKIILKIKIFYNVYLI